MMAMVEVYHFDATSFDNFAQSQNGYVPSYVFVRVTHNNGDETWFSSFNAGYFYSEFKNNCMKRNADYREDNRTEKYFRWDNPSVSTDDVRNYFDWYFP